MANKRQIKKAIRNACGDMAGECIFAQDFFGEGKEEQWDQIIVNVALLQESALERVDVKFDRAPGSFASGSEYRKARRAFNRQAMKALKEYMHSETEKSVASMNELMPKKS